MSKKFPNPEQPPDPRAAAFAAQQREDFNRCKKCSLDPDGNWGTPLSVRDVSATLPDGTNIVVARVAQCLRCGQVYAIKMKNAAGEHGIYAAGLEACIKESRGAIHFLDELQAGRLRQGPAFPDKADTIKVGEDAAHADVSGGTRQPEPAAELW